MSGSASVRAVALEHIGELEARATQLKDMIKTLKHLVDACAEVASELLRACPRLRMLCTSRQPLSLPGEVVWRLEEELPGTRHALLRTREAVV